MSWNIRTLCDTVEKTDRKGEKTKWMKKNGVPRTWHYRDLCLSRRFWYPDWTKPSFAIGEKRSWMITDSYMKEPSQSEPSVATWKPTARKVLTDCIPRPGKMRGNRGLCQPTS